MTSIVIIVVIVVIGDRITKRPSSHGTGHRNSRIHRLHGTAVFVISGLATHAGTQRKPQHTQRESA